MHRSALLGVVLMELLTTETSPDHMRWPARYPAIHPLLYRLTTHSAGTLNSNKNGNRVKQRHIADSGNPKQVYLETNLNHVF